jgi:hypothetical protein
MLVKEEEEEEGKDAVWLEWSFIAVVEHDDLVG